MLPAHFLATSPTGWNEDLHHVELPWLAPMWSEWQRKIHGRSQETKLQQKSSYPYESDAIVIKSESDWCPNSPRKFTPQLPNVSVSVWISPLRSSPWPRAANGPRHPPLQQGPRTSGPTPPASGRRCAWGWDNLHGLGLQTNSCPTRHGRVFHLCQDRILPDICGRMEMASGKKTDQRRAKAGKCNLWAITLRSGIKQHEFPDDFCEVHMFLSMIFWSKLWWFNRRIDQIMLHSHLFDCKTPNFLIIVPSY